MTTLLTTIEAANYLKIAANTLRNWRSQGKAPKFYKLNQSKALRYKMEDLDAFVADSLMDTRSGESV